MTLSIMLVYSLIFFVLFLLIVERWKSGKIHKQLREAKKYLPIIGHAIQFIGNNEDIMKALANLHARAWKREHNILTGWIGNNLFVVVADADKACKVLKTALEKTYIHKLGKVLIGNGSIIGPVEFWHRRRKILLPTFSPRHVNNFVSIFEAQSKVTADLLESKVGKGNILCFEYFCRLSLDSVCETLFGVDFNIQRNPSNRIFNAFMESQKILVKRAFQPLLYIDFIYKLLPMAYREKRLVKIVHEFVDDLIQKKRNQMNKQQDDIEEPDTGTNKMRTAIKTFVELMIENISDADETNMSEELREESLVLVLAGTETSAISVCFIVLLLSQHAEIQDKVYKEIQEIIGDTDEPLSLENLQKLKYMKAVIKETLRLYPPVPFLMRQCDKDLVLDDLTLPKDCKVLISVWGIHRKPEYWGADVDDFNPERFMTGHINPNNFLTFSYGARNCLGQHYSMLSIMTVLVTVLRRYRFTPATNFEYDKNKPLRLSFEVLIKHVDNFPVQVEYRHRHEQNSKNG